MTVFDNILFYTGYDATSTAPVPTGVQRINNSLYVRKFSDAELAGIGKDLKMDVVIKADCDNYDRIGRVYFSLIKKGENYNEQRAKNIEIGRFITPFMDKNKAVKEVPYHFSLTNLSDLLQDKTIRANYDVWVGFSVFGVSYSAQKEVVGCSNSNATFFGTLKFSSSPSTTVRKDSVNIVSLSYMKMAGDGEDNELNKSNKTATGAERTIPLTLSKALKGVKLYLITSSHGANPEGEEYVRRVHNVYFDNQLKSSFTPGGKSCEPFRQYNTQFNRIYFDSALPDSYWSRLNWCAGDVIPIREISLGDLAAGHHTFKIEVKDAQFVEGKGNIIASAYLQGTE
ncbi:hypothetical protein BWD42_07225 [Sphingobacterium sp. CZ-UAM]|nr:hypothetical protein BWD42_07225 [Sphingobacterium sp. CZ-UAM]